MHKSYRIALFTLVMIAGLSPSRADVTGMMYTKLRAIQDKVQASSSDLISMQESDRSGIPQLQRQCQAFWKPLLNKTKIRIDYFTGYNNNRRSFVRDGYEREALMAILVTPCTQSQKQVCGFQKVGSNLYTKTLRMSEGRSRQIEFYLRNASASPNDAANRDSAAQKIKSHETRLQFIESARQTDILIYSGHSRYGGGPDFSPEIMAENGDENPGPYRKAKAGLKDLLSGLNSRQDSGAFLVFLGSCDSQKHFHDHLARQTSKLHFSLLGNSVVYEDDTHLQFFNLMQLILNEGCPRDFKSYFENYQLNQHKKL